MADAEAVFGTWLTDRFPDSFVCTETPPDIQNLPSTIRVTRAGGPKKFTLDSARVVIDTFAPTRQAARALAYQVDHAVTFELRGQTVAGVVVSLVETTSGPTWVPDPNTNLRRFVATYSSKLRNIP